MTQRVRTTLFGRFAGFLVDDIEDALLCTPQILRGLCALWHKIDGTTSLIHLHAIVAERRINDGHDRLIIAEHGKDTNY